MPPFKQLSDSKVPWFSLGVVGIFLVSLGLRFWGLGRFNTFVFDEVYYVKFANNYLTKTQFFDGHPPLSKYLIAIGIWLGEQVPWWSDAPKNALAGSLLSPLSYRWLNAFTGSFIPLVVLAIAQQLTQRRAFAFIAGLFAAADGLFLVESRYALNNVYLVIFGLLGQLCFLLALNGMDQRRRKARQRLAFHGYLLLAGLCFGATAAIKWNGLWFLLGAYFLWGVAWIMRLAQAWRSRSNPDSLPSPTSQIPPLLRRVTQVNIFAIAFYLALIPFAFYSLLWIPHIQLNPAYGFWEVQQQILSYHQRVSGNDSGIHPYCSAWYTWPWMIRPVVYLYETALSPLDPVPTKPPLPVGVGKLVYDVHAMGNPFLWWLSTAAILMLVWLLAERFQAWATNSGPVGGDARKPAEYQAETWVAVYLVANYGANLLPWVRVTRCTFLYHYMGASVFASLALAWLVERWLRSYRPWIRIAGVTIIFLVLLAFVFWMPLYLGLPLSPDAAKLRRWFTTW